MLENLSPRQKKILIAVLAGGGLALVALLGRGRGGAAAAADPGALATPTNGSAGTFADNGAYAAGLGTDVTGALGDVAVALDQLPDLVGTQVGSAVRDSMPLQPVATTPSADEFAAAFAPAFAAALGPIATPAGAVNATAVKQATSTTRAPAAAAAPAPTAAQARAAAAPNVAFQTSGTRAGLDFKTVVKDAKVYRFYESKPGKADYGEGGKVYIRPATGGH